MTRALLFKLIVRIPLFVILLLGSVVVVLTGCSPRDRAAKKTIDPMPFAATPPPKLLVVYVFDLSGSYTSQLETRIWPFFGKLQDSLSRDRPLEDDQVVIAQLSLAPNPLVWSGSSRHLKKSFGSSSEFKKTLVAASNPNGSPCYKAVANVLSYVNGLPHVKSGATKVLVVVASDMEDNDPGVVQARANFLGELRQLHSQTHGGLLFVGIDQQIKPRLEGELASAQFPVDRYRIVQSFENEIPLPNLR
jgi:hypothetical protein